MDPAFIESLRDPAIYPEKPDRVGILQTHLSVVVLSGDYAYKFKKSIRLPFADFTDPENRRWLCQEEVRLNRRLCPRIYEEVVELRRDASGRLRLGGTGELVDCAVKMRRLPQERMMDVLLEEGRVTEAEVIAVARRVIAFHRDAERGPAVDAAGDPRKLCGFALANFSETRGFFPEALHRALEERTREDFDRLLPLLMERAASGCLVDGHGDLHARNICLVEPPAIYDCIEFCPAFRCGDTALEHAFLLMDLRFRGHPELARRYLDIVLEESGDDTIGRVLPLFMRYRAMVRAKVAAITAGEGEFTGAERAAAKETAHRYFRLAAALAVEDGAPRWLLCCGLPASGKSVAASALAAASGGAWPVLSSDRIRKELAGVSATDRLPAAFYGEAFSKRTYGELLARAVAATTPGGVVIIDANFRSRAGRKRFREAAGAAGAACDLLFLEPGEETALERLRIRSAEGGSVSDADGAVYEALKREFDVPEAGEADRFIRLPGVGEPGAVADDCFERWLGAAPRDAPGTTGP
jgi:aminoglycoside phosphotransferase family enzyme/predicted kinase